MDRTQIYMEPGQKEALAALSKETGESQSALIRTAIDRYLSEHVEDKDAKRKAFLQEGFGMWKDDPERTQEYFAAIRATADARIKRVWGGLSDHEQEEIEGRE